MKVLVFLAEGFEEVEAVTPIDILRRAGAQVVTVGIGGTEVIGSHGIKIVADISEECLYDLSADIIVLPGGMPGTLNLDASALVHRAIDAAVENGSFICAVCAAPRILGKLGLLDGRRAVCYPGNEEFLRGAEIAQTRVAVDGRLITARGMGASGEFALEIVAQAFGREKADELRTATVSL